MLFIERSSRTQTLHNSQLIVPQFLVEYINVCVHHLLYLLEGSNMCSSMYQIYFQLFFENKIERMVKAKRLLKSENHPKPSQKGVIMGRVIFVV